MVKEVTAPTSVPAGPTSEGGYPAGQQQEPSGFCGYIILAWVS